MRNKEHFVGLGKATRQRNPSITFPVGVVRVGMWAEPDPLLFGGDPTIPGRGRAN